MSAIINVWLAVLGRAREDSMAVGQPRLALEAREWLESEDAASIYEYTSVLSGSRRTVAEWRGMLRAVWETLTPLARSEELHPAKLARIRWNVSLSEMARVLGARYETLMDYESSRLVPGDRWLSRKLSEVGNDSAVFSYLAALQAAACADVRLVYST